MNRDIPIVEAKNLGRQADDGSWLLWQVNFKIFPGDRLGVVGPSGSGKTVLLRSLAALDPLQNGQLLLAGRPVAGNEIPAYRTQVIYLPQRPVLFEGTVESNLQKPFEMAIHRKRRYQRQRIVTWLESLGRDATFLEKQQQNLSGGELQIAALLRAIQLNPQVLLLDEPTAALDTTAASAVERLVNGWLKQRQSQGAFVWVTHQLEQADNLCDKVYPMNAGQLTTS